MDSTIYALMLAKDQNEPLPPGQTKRLKYVSEIAPDHPEVMRRTASRMLREKQPAQAIKRLTKLIEKHPYYPPAYVLLFKVCADQGVPLPESVLTGNAIVACSESAERLVALGQAFQDKGYVVNAVAAQALAAQLEPQNPMARAALAASLDAAKK
jgi:predicted Zn-dependent protease